MTLDAGNTVDTAAKIPTLEKIIATMPDGKGLVIEIKHGSDLPARLKEILTHSGKPLSHFSIISFAREAVKTFREILPECPALWIVDYKPRQHQLTDLIRQCREDRLDGLDLNRRWPIDQAFVQQVKDHALLLYTWTVDNARTAQRQMESGVDGITTNRPGWLREALVHPA